MEQEEILKRAISKAVKNGMKEYRWLFDKNPPIAIKEMIKANGHYTIIFSFPFAKAFWGEKDYWKDTKCTCGGVDFHLAGFDAHHSHCTKLKAKRGYKYHLQQMVLAEDRLKYIEKFLK